MPNEKLPEINEHDAEELIHYPQDEEQKERRSRLLPGRWTRRVQKSSARAQARRRVAEKTSEDHAYLMLGAVPFWAAVIVAAAGLVGLNAACGVLLENQPNARPKVAPTPAPQRQQLVFRVVRGGRAA